MLVWFRQEFMKQWFTFRGMLRIPSFNSILKLVIGLGYRHTDGQTLTTILQEACYGFNETGVNVFIMNSTAGNGNPCEVSEVAKKSNAKRRRSRGREAWGWVERSGLATGGSTVWNLIRLIYRQKGWKNSTTVFRGFILIGKQISRT
jgi:hypothetical protein